MQSRNLAEKNCFSMLNAKPEIFYCCLKLINARIIAKKSEVQKLYMQMMSYFILNLIAYAIFYKIFFFKD